MSFRIGPDCDGCGICALACPRGAIHPVGVPVPTSPSGPDGPRGSDGERSGGSLVVTDSAFLDTILAYSVTGIECNDCRTCTIVCPQDAIERDPEWAVCWGRGCPLTSKRYEGWACTEGLRRCSCGSSMWKRPGEKVWVCARCDLDSKVICPKARKAATLEDR